MSIVWLVRHAESQANAGGRTTNPAEIEITSRGQEQARHVAYLISQPPQLIITSPYLRTKQTAWPLIERFPNVRQAEWPVYEFTYLAPERCQNTTAQERQPLVTEYWKRNDPSYVDGSGAESFADLLTRTERLIADLKPLENDFVIIFSHGQFIRTLLWRLLSGSTEISAPAMKQCRNFMTSFELPNSAIVKLHLESEQKVWISSVESQHIPSELLTL